MQHQQAITGQPSQSLVIQPPNQIQTTPGNILHPSTERPTNQPVPLPFNNPPSRVLLLANHDQPIINTDTYIPPENTRPTPKHRPPQRYSYYVSEILFPLVILFVV